MDSPVSNYKANNIIFLLLINEIYKTMSLRKQVFAIRCSGEYAPVPSLSGDVSILLAIDNDLKLLVSTHAL